MSRYVIIGGGAVGASLAAELHRAGIDTVLVARGAQLAALRSGGLRYVRPDGEHHLHPAVAGGPAEVGLTGDDVLVLATKTTDSAAAVTDWAWQPVKRADGTTGVAAFDLPLVTLQNGLETERIALRSFATVIGATIWIPATFITPGQVVNHGAPVPAILWLGPYPPVSLAAAPPAAATLVSLAAAPSAASPASSAAASPASSAASSAAASAASPAAVISVVSSIAGDLRRGGFTVHEVADVTGNKAGKLLGNLVNSLDALYAASPLRDAAVAALRAEAHTVFAAAGITPVSPRVDDFQPAEIPGHERAGNSTRQSLARSAVPETDYLDGEIVLLARLHGVAAPLAAAVQARVHRAVAEATPAASLDDDDLAVTLPSVAAQLTADPDPGPDPVAAEGTGEGAAAVVAADAAVGSQETADSGGAVESGGGEVVDDAPGAPGAPGAVPAGVGDVRGAVLAGAGEVRRLAAGAQPPVLLDVRWALGDPHGAEHYRAGHLPGAVYVDLDTELAGAHEPGAGRHPLPAIEDLQAAARRWGITRDSAVVVYDNSGGLAAARAWWLLRWAGVTDVRILDGGLAAWQAAGYPEATGTAHPRPAGDVVLSPGHLPTLTADEAAALPTTGTLLDARAGERYRGETEPIDPRAGHIPGAISRPTGGNLSDGVPTFRTADELRERFAGLPGPIGVYCGSGVTAAHQIAALATLGVEAALYPGSWSAWSSDPDRPAATGAQP